MRPLDRLALAVAAVLVAATGLRLLIASLPGDAGPVPAAAVPPAVALPDDDQLAAALARNPFSPIGAASRPEAGLAPPAAGPPPALTLTGVMLGPDWRRALVRTADGQSRVLAEGQAVAGWRVARVEPGRLVLAGADGEVVVPLGRAGNGTRAGEERR